MPACEYNPPQAVRISVVLGAQAHRRRRHRHRRVRRVVVALSTDKAVNPVNLYGATKLCEEKIIVQGNAYAAGSDTRLSCVRYGKRRGLPLRLRSCRWFRRQAERFGRLTITDERMTRFWISLDEAVDLVMTALERSIGGEIFIPKIPSMRVTDLAEGRG